jgi:hypothetical protein
MRGIAVPVLALAVATFEGCDNGSRVFPAPSKSPAAPTPTLPTVPIEIWDLTTVETAVTGPDNCFTQQQLAAGIPRSGSWALAVTRRGNVVTFEYAPDLQETGPLEANQFTAQSASARMSSPSCPDGTVLSGTFDATVTGRFSDDGTHLTAKETWVYRFRSGEITLSMDWSADRVPHP